MSPLLDPACTVLDERQRGVVERVATAERARILQLPSDDPLDLKRLSRVKATKPELVGQPDAIVSTLSRNDAELGRIATRLASGFERVVLVGAGDSLAVMVAAREALESMLGIVCEPVQSLEFAYYQAPLVGPSTAVITLSSSGETARTLEALLVAQNQGSYTVALTNTAGSTLQREASTSLLLDATRVGWPTQSSTTALALLLELAVRIGELRSVPEAADLRIALRELPSEMREVIARLDPEVAAIAEHEVTASTVLFSAGGPNLAAAIVGAAKVKECTPLRATEIQVEEYHHYNSQKAGEPLFLLVPSGPAVPRAVETATDAHRWGGRLYVATTSGEHAFDALEPESILELPELPESLSPLLYLVPAQLLGYHLGMAGFRAAKAASAAERNRS
jgi:glucosamine--fructose-6-phosphate aminotransferase (isomerizing)